MWKQNSHFKVHLDNPIKSNRTEKGPPAQDRCDRRPMDNPAEPGPKQAQPSWEGTQQDHPRLAISSRSSDSSSGPSSGPRSSDMQSDIEDLQYKWFHIQMIFLQFFPNWDGIRTLRCRQKLDSLLNIECVQVNIIIKKKKVKSWLNSYSKMCKRDFRSLSWCFPV